MARRTVAEGVTSPMGHGTLASTGLVPVLALVLLCVWVCIYVAFVEQPTTWAQA